MVNCATAVVAHVSILTVPPVSSHEGFKFSNWFLHKTYNVITHSTKKHLTNEQMKKFKKLKK